MPTTTLSVDRRLRRVQLGARATLTLGIGASLAANVLAAEPSVVGRVIAGWSPVALLLTVELLSRVPSSGGRLSRLRITAAAAIAVIAAWVSYWHIVEVAEAVGEPTVAAHLLPLSIDGLVVVASVCLVEITDRLNQPPTQDRNVGAPAGRQASRTDRTTPPAPAEQRRQQSASGSAEVVRRLAAEHPDWTRTQLAEAAGCSTRTVRRHLATTTPPPPNGNHANDETEEIWA